MRPVAPPRLTVEGCGHTRLRGKPSFCLKALPLGKSSKLSRHQAHDQTPMGRAGKDSLGPDPGLKTFLLTFFFEGND